MFDSRPTLLPYMVTPKYQGTVALGMAHPVVLILGVELDQGSALTHRLQPGMSN